MTFCNCTMGGTAACEGCPNNPYQYYHHYYPNYMPYYTHTYPTVQPEPVDAEEQAIRNRQTIQKTIVEEYDENGKLIKRTITQ